MKTKRLLTLVLLLAVAGNAAVLALMWREMKREFARNAAKGDGALNVMDYGAACDARADDTAAFRAVFKDAAAKRIAVLIPGRTCLINGPLSITDDMVIRADGATLKHGAFNGPLLSAVSADGWSVSGPLTLEGSRAKKDKNEKDNSGADESGFYISGGSHFTVDKLTLAHFRGFGIRIEAGGQAHKSAGGRGNHGQFAFISFIDNHIGLQADAGTNAEYNLFTLLSFTGNDLAANIAAGNNVITTSNIVDNQNGLLLSGGINHGHGIVAASNINHSAGYDIKADHVELGFTFSGCHVYSSAGRDDHVVLDASKGIEFSGCVVSPAAPVSPPLK